MYLQVKMNENSTKMVFRENKIKNKVSSSIFRRFEDGKMVRLIF